MSMNGPSSNNAAVGGGSGGVSSPCNQVVSAVAPPQAVVTVAAENSAPAGERCERFDDAGNNGGGGKKQVWNKPSANGGGGGGGSSSMEEVKPMMDDADSWPALLDSARATAKSPSLSEPPSGKTSLPELQGIGSDVLSSQRQVRDNTNMHNGVPSHQRMYKRSNSNISSNGVYSPNLSGSQVSLAASGSHNHGPRSGFVPNDHHSQRNAFRNRNVGPHPRGDGANHHKYGGRRDQGYGNQEWNNHRNFNGRGNFMSQRFGPRFISPPPPLPHPSPPPPLPHPSPPAPIYPPPTAIRPFNHIGFPELHNQMVYVPPPMDSLRGYPFPPSITPSIVFFHPPDPHLHTKIVNQIDYYFSNENLIKDLYLRQHMDDQGWVPVSLIAGFNKVRQLTEDIQIVLEAIRTSSVVEIQGDKIRRRNDWRRWVIPHGQFPNVTSSQTIGRLAERWLAERVHGITMEATNKEGAREPDVTQNGELNSQLSQSTKESTDQL